MTEVQHLFLKKDGSNSLDMRFKENKEFVKKYLHRSRFDRTMQKLADRLGAKSPGAFGGCHWSLWFSPNYQFHRLLWKFGIYKPYKL